MYFTRYDTYNNNQKWKPDNTKTIPTNGKNLTIDNKKYYVKSFRTINPVIKNPYNLTIGTEDIINGSDFRAKPMIKNGYRYQYQTKSNNPGINLLSTSSSNYRLLDNTPGNSIFTKLANKTQLCQYPEYEVNLSNDRANTSVVNARRRVRNSNRPSQNICNSNNESKDHTYDKQLYDSNFNYYNQRYNFDEKQYLNRKCKSYDNNDKININRPVQNKEHAYKGNCNNSVLPNIYNIQQAKCCNTVIYKPNNKQFQQQGAVSSSARLAALKRKTVDKSSYTTNKRHDVNVMVSASGYNNSFNNYTSKSKQGSYNYVKPGTV
jgi:hypothetical protein